MPDQEDRDLPLAGRVYRIENFLWIGKNGQPTLRDQVRDQGTKLDDLKLSLDALRKSINEVLQERQTAKDKRAGRIEVATWVKWAFAALGVGGPLLAGLGYRHLVAVLDRIASVVNSLPPLP